MGFECMQEKRRGVDEVVVTFITADAMLASTLASILWDEESEPVGADDDKVSVSVPVSLTLLVALGVGEIDRDGVVPDMDTLIIGIGRHTSVSFTDSICNLGLGIEPRLSSMSCRMGKVVLVQ